MLKILLTGVPPAAKRGLREKRFSSTEIPNETEMGRVEVTTRHAGKLCGYDLIVDIQRDFLTSSRALAKA